MNEEKLRLLLLLNKGANWAFCFATATATTNLLVSLIIGRVVYSSITLFEQRNKSRFRFYSQSGRSGRTRKREDRRHCPLVTADKQFWLWRHNQWANKKEGIRIECGSSVITCVRVSLRGSTRLSSVWYNKKNGTTGQYGPAAAAAAAAVRQRWWWR